MDKNWEMKTRESFRRASLEDSLVGFIGSVDESEQFEGYGARFNAKCVESVTEALKDHSRALQQHQDSVNRVHGAIANIQKLLWVMAICSITLVIGNFLPGNKGISPTSVARNKTGENSNLLVSPSPIPKAQPSSFDTEDEIAGELKNIQGNLGMNISPRNSNSGIENDDLLKPSRVDLINRIKERSKISESDKNSSTKSLPY